MIKRISINQEEFLLYGDNPVAWFCGNILVLQNDLPDSIEQLIDKEYYWYSWHSVPSTVIEIVYNEFKRIQNEK